VIDEAFLRAELAEPLTLPAHTIGSLLDAGQLQNLSGQLQNLSAQQEFLPEIRQNPALFSNGQLLPTASAAALLGAIRNQLQTGGMDKDSLLDLLSGKEFGTLLKDAMEQQWMLKPEEITQKDKINRLYEKVEDQLTRLEDVIKATGQQNDNVSNLASNIRSNVEFMNEINQAYTYVQIPLQMAGQNASGELYVYTNKKNLAEGKDELSAFLHLDMDHLGATDVSVKLHGRNVSTNFYFDNDEAFALVQAHAPVLEERLKEKGYNSTIKVVNESNRVNFVDDFLKKDQPSKGLVHRYSFDMKA
jgi:flagellar hook-length control protein FliK